MEKLSIVGTVKSVGEQVTKGTFTFAEIVVETGDKYPQLVKFTLAGKSLSSLQYIKVGEESRVFFNIRGREYNGVVYNTLAAWRVEKIQAEVEEQVNTENIPF